MIDYEHEPLYAITPQLIRKLARLGRVNRLRPLKDGRKQLSAALEPSLKEAIRDYCLEQNCSMSKFAGTALADKIKYQLDRRDRFDMIPAHALVEKPTPKHVGRGGTPAAAARKRKRLTKGSEDASTEAAR